MRCFGKRLLRFTLVAIALLVLAIPLVSRIKGVVIGRYDGKVTGYAKDAGVWLFNEYPPVPARRDGPYVIDAVGQRIALNLVPTADGEARAVRTPVDGDIDVIVDDAVGTRFTVPLRSRYPRPALQWPMPERLLAVSDLEGNFAAATRLLRAQGVIDAQLHWAYGRGQLVLLGDMVDRGDNVVPLLWLLYRLEAEAAAAGGALHYVLGNHEQYLLQGRMKSTHDKYYGSARVAGSDHGDLWSPRTELGRWLRSKPVMVRVGDTLFTHGGVSPQVLAAGLDLAAIDRLAARYTGVFAEPDNPGMEAILGRHGLSWYRGLAKATESTPLASAAHVDALLAKYGARRIAIGHTLTAHVGQAYGGRVLRTDVAHVDGVNEGILFADGDLWRVDAAGGRAALASAVNLTE
ncbi:MAG: metallophosphoesterase [Thermomonas sp.]|uniref:metallophosphoesterase n=1 Tax=Thermomonas sp. TaxID=1971895 RepID=UPI00262F3895|nr:metallophosphoesterase [Thermomonas sp.]MCC7097367.1 metallophosphoesterase [Thermomonas sp.]